MKNETNDTKGSLFQPEEIPRSLFYSNSFIFLRSVLCLLDMKQGRRIINLSRFFNNVYPSPRTGSSSFYGLFIPALSRF